MGVGVPNMLHPLQKALVNIKTPPNTPLDVTNPISLYLLHKAGQHWTDLKQSLSNRRGTEVGARSSPAL